MPIKFTIITAVYNNVRHIQHCIDSLNSQTYKNFEHIVIDANSNDGTSEILKANKDKITKLVIEPDKGVCDAWNKGLSLASGNVVGFLHADDFFATNKCLEKMASYFNADTKIDAIYSNVDHVAENDIQTTKRKWKSKQFKSYLIKLGWMPPHPSLYVKKIHYEDNLFDLNFKISGDYLSILRMFSKNNFKSVYLDFTSLKMRQGGVSNRVSNFLHKYNEDFLALKLSGYNVLLCFFIIFSKNIQKIFQVRFF
jgi:glycosyltransferase